MVLFLFTDYYNVRKKMIQPDLTKVKHDKEAEKLLFWARVDKYK